VTELDLSRPFTVRSFGFNIPCRRFVLAAKVTRDRRMPLVDEFVLRALKLADQLTLSRLARFFGFSTGEVQIVVADLVARSLVVLDGENVRLHQSANEMFRTSPDGVPTVLEVESWVENLWFDLISKSMILREIRRGSNLVEIAPPDTRESVSAEFARAAFEENFREYLKNYRKIHNPDALSLYAVTDVQPGQYGHVAVAGTEELVLYPEPKLQPSLLEIEGDRPQRARKLIEAMRRAYDELTHPESSAAARTEYSKLVGSDSLQNASFPNGHLDLQKWQQLEVAECPPGTGILLGSSYIERNRQLCRSLVEERGASGGQSARGLPPELLWFRPTGSSWGASEDLRAMLADLRAAARAFSEGRASPRATLIFPAAERASHPKRFNRLFDAGLLAPPGYLPTAVEVLILRGVFAATLVWVPLAESCGVWVGRATNRPDDLATIETRLQLTDLERQSTRLWPEAGKGVSRGEAGDDQRPT
jgi:hypothetical protein